MKKKKKKAGFSPIRQCRNEQSRMPLVTPQGRGPRFFTSFAVTPGCFPVPWDCIPAHERSSKRAELADLVHPTSAPSPRATRPSLAVPSGVVHRKPGDSITKRRGNWILGMVSATTILINGIMLLYGALVSLAETRLLEVTGSSDPTRSPVCLPMLYTCFCYCCCYC